MSALLLDYLPLVVFIAVALVIGLVLLIAPFIVAYKRPDPEKLSAYECGFNPFDDARMKFDVRYYLVAILFNYLRYQQRRKKSFYRFSIIYRLGIRRHMGLGFESISAFGAGPKIEDKLLAHVFRPFGDK
jgi:NADH-ubiquinone/plastoquinone oxidoreductase, chain 3